MTTATISNAQARQELARRQAPKGSALRNKRPARHVMEASNDLLLSIVAPKAKAPTKAPKATAKATAAAKGDDLKAQANQAWKAAFDAAEDGDRKRSAGKAYRLVIEGTPLATVLAAING